MANLIQRGLRSALSRASPGVTNAVTTETLTAAGLSLSGDLTSTAPTAAMKLSAVDRCVEILSDSMGKLPIYVVDRATRQRVDHPICQLLSVRPNEGMTPTVLKKMVEANRNCRGNGFILIDRDPRSLTPAQLIPVPGELVTPWKDTAGQVWYTITHPDTGQPMTVHRSDMVHLMAYTHDGYRGISVLQRASEVITSARAAQQYTANYYANGGQPSGVLTVDGDLGKTKIKKEDGSFEVLDRKDLIREEWNKRHAGPNHAQQIAILDHGLKYTPISVTNRDAQFVEQAALSVEDIARFFGVPLYKLQAGKQSYSSNEQNAIDYVVSTLHPIVTQWEEELTWKLLPVSEAKRLKIRINMMAELRGDFASRGTWYRTLLESGVYSINEIRELEDLPAVEGGDEHLASLNYVPLGDWKQLSQNRNGGEEHDRND